MGAEVGRPLTVPFAPPEKLTTGGEDTIRNPKEKNEKERRKKGRERKKRGRGGSTFFCPASKDDRPKLTT